MLKLKQRIIRTQKGETRRWYIKGTCPYTRRSIRESTGTDSKEEADHQLACYLARAREESILGTCNGTALFAEAVAEYLGKHGEARFISPLLEKFGTTRLRDIQDSAITKLGEALYPAAKASTLVRQLYGPMQAVWNAAERAKMVGPRKFAKPKIKTDPVKFADDAWLLAFIRLANPRLRAIVVFMSFTGARVSEACRLTWEDVDLAEPSALLQITKSGRGRKVVLHDIVVRAFAALPRGRGAIFGFSSRFSVNTALKRLCARAGIEYFSSHQVGRHAFAARLIKAGESMRVIQQAGGWSSLQMLDRHYGHLETKQYQDAMRNAPAVSQYRLLMESSAAAIPAQPGQRCVYVVGYDGFIKIGVAYDVVGRMRELQTGAPQRLTHYQTILVDEAIALRVEAEVHSRLAEHKTHGEWFECQPQLAVSTVAEVVSLIHGTLAHSQHTKLVPRFSDVEIIDEKIPKTH